MSFLDNIPGSDLHEKLENVVDCNCCERHQINKPRVLAPWVETPWNNTHNSLYACQCDCRHIARFICRNCVQKDAPKEVETYRAYSLAYNDIEPHGVNDEDMA